MLESAGIDIYDYRYVLRRGDARHDPDDRPAGDGAPCWTIAVLIADPAERQLPRP
jgi:hypothetical protein